jgi:hypothetical protein
MAGRRNAWEGIAARMKMPKEEVRARLDRIVTRRNQIVHEGDYRRLERPQDGSRNVMYHADARADIEFLERLVNAIHASG